MSPFSSVPDGCIANIISFTSPTDACRAAAVSLAFRSAAESDTVWERFLPPDYEELISESDSPVPFSTKKELYYLLSDSGLLLNGGKLSLRLSKSSGKKCYMLCPRELQIAWKDTPVYWNWKFLPESRFAQVAELLSVYWLDIRGTFPSERLSPNTNYAAYLVFKLTDNHYGLDCPSKVSVKCVGGITTEVEEVRTTFIAPRRARQGRMVRQFWRRGAVAPRSRTDGWMEIELGKFFVPEQDRFDVQARLFEIYLLNGKKGLIIEGIEVRPMEVF